MTDQDFTAIQYIIHYNFNNKNHLERAFIHSSYANQEGIASNERMEFFGDAILQLVVSEYIFMHSKDDEGVLSRIRANTVSADSLSNAVNRLGLNRYLVLGDSQMHAGASLHYKVYANLYESILCAIYLDGGLDSATGFIMRTLKEQLDMAIMGDFFDSPKTRLQEYCQKLHIKLDYVEVGRSGPDHNPTFTYLLLMNGREVTRGTGNSKATAQTMAANKALQVIYDKESNE
ncbi:MAG: ribonuclease III [Clostridia bacterium]|nr:ribonuclease III [Clostridia bacterium]